MNAAGDKGVIVTILACLVGGETARLPVQADLHPAHYEVGGGHG